MEQASPKLYTSTFLLLCISFGLFGGSFNMIIPELPAYLTSLGGAEYKGLIISLFTLTAGFSRPFSGKLADKIGRKPVIIIGTIVCVICSLVYPLLSSVAGFLLLRFFHGFSTGFSPTAITAYIAVASSICALISMMVVLRLKETVTDIMPFSFSILKLKKTEVIDRNSIAPAVVCGLCYMGFGAMITITPDQCEFYGMSNKGLFFTSFTLCSVMARIFAGQLSDRFGRIPVLRFSIIVLGAAYVFLGSNSSPLILLIGTGTIGFGLGVAMPGIFAWTVDRSNDNNRGQAIATVYIGLEVAIGIGALIGAALYDNTASNYNIVFYVMAIMAILSLVVLRRKSE